MLPYLRSHVTRLLSTITTDMGISEFTAAATKNFALIRQSPYYIDGVGSLDALYARAIRTAPPEGFPVFYGRLLLVCHKSMVSAANLIASCLPEDSVGVTRRAIEAAKVANAIRLNDENAQKWLAQDERHERWLRRQEGDKPKPFHVRFEDLKGDDLSAVLDTFIGILSDAYLHFTPEFYGTLGWQIIAKPEGGLGGYIHLSYFQPEIRELERHFMLLAAIHGKILSVFDRCYDGRFMQTDEYRRALDVFSNNSKRLNADYQQRYGVQAAPE